MENQDLIKQISGPLYAGKGWLTFLGVLSIVYGVFMALSIVGLLFAWLPIWSGVLLIQAGNALEAARHSGDAAALTRALARLKTYFVIWGVIALVGLLLGLATVGLGFGFGLFAGGFAGSGAVI